MKVPENMRAPVKPTLSLCKYFESLGFYSLKNVAAADREVSDLGFRGWKAGDAESREISASSIRKRPCHVQIWLLHSNNALALNYTLGLQP